jgi:hypothetical protein
LSIALKAVLEDNSTELDKVQEKGDKDLGKEDKSRLLINALSHMLKKLEGLEKQLKEQKQRQKAQEEQLSLQKEQLDRLSWLSVWLDQTNEMRTQ